MQWKMKALSEYTLNLLEKTAGSGDAVADAFLLLKGMLRPYTRDAYLTYRYEHSLRTAGRGVAIAEGEGWNVEPLLIACLLHDVGYPECTTEEDFSHHQEVSALIAEIFLDKIGYDAAQAKSICRAIQIHNLWNDVPDDVSAFELSVRDADDLDRFDILRTYRAGNAIVGNAFICDRSARQIIADCEKQLCKINEHSGHMCATRTAQQLWDEQLNERRNYFRRLIEQMRTTLAMEVFLDSR